MILDVVGKIGEDAVHTGAHAMCLNVVYVIMSRAYSYVVITIMQQLYCTIFKQVFE